MPKQMYLFASIVTQRAGQVWILPPGLELKSPGREPRIPKREKAHNISGFFDGSNDWDMMKLQVVIDVYSPSFFFF